MRGIDGLKNGSPLGVEPKGEGITGPTGYSISGESTGSSAPAQPATATPNSSQPKSNVTSEPAAGEGLMGATKVNAPLPVARVLSVDYAAEPIRP
jgi:hypothetical protein